MKTTIALLLAASLTGCVEPPHPAPMPDFLTMCNGDKACVELMIYREEVRREEAALDRRARQRQSASNALGNLSRQLGEMGGYKGYRGYHSRTTTVCRKYGAIIRCTTQ